MYAPCPHATSASVWVAVGRPRATDLGGVGGGFYSAVYIGDTADYGVKVLCCYVNLPFAGEMSTAARLTKLSRVNGLRRGPLAC
jgi:hypothetical protein